MYKFPSFFLLVLQGTKKGERKKSFVFFLLFIVREKFVNDVIGLLGRLLGVYEVKIKRFTSLVTYSKLQ